MLVVFNFSMYILCHQVPAFHLCWLILILVHSKSCLNLLLKMVYLCHSVHSVEIHRAHKRYLVGLRVFSFVEGYFFRGKCVLLHPI